MKSLIKHMTANICNFFIFQVSYVILNGTTWGLEVKGVDRVRRDAEDSESSLSLPILDTRNVPTNIENLLYDFYSPKSDINDEEKPKQRCSDKSTNHECSYQSDAPTNDEVLIAYNETSHYPRHILNTYAYNMSQITITNSPHQPPSISSMKHYKMFYEFGENNATASLVNSTTAATDAVVDIDSLTHVRDGQILKVEQNYVPPIIKVTFTKYIIKGIVNIYWNMKLIMNSSLICQ